MSYSDNATVNRMAFMIMPYSLIMNNNNNKNRRSNMARVTTGAP